MFAYVTDVCIDVTVCDLLHDVETTFSEEEIRCVFDDNSKMIFVKSS